MARGSRRVSVQVEPELEPASKSLNFMQSLAGADGTTGASVIRLNPEMTKGGLAPLEAMGMRIASSGELARGGAALDMGEGVIYFERFGIAIIGSDDPGRLQSIFAAGAEDRSILGRRPERVFRALGMEVGSDQGAQSQSLAAPVTGSRDYLLGYLQGVTSLVGNLLGGTVPSGGGFASPAVLPLPAAAFTLDETAYTWGLQATRTTASKFTGKGIKVAILDTGLDYNHPDFVGRKIVKQSFTGEDVLDLFGHGTHCAGTVCGPAAPSGVPRYGVACDADLYIGKVLFNNGLGSDRTVIAGLEWALNSGCEVISLSLGSPMEAADAFIEDYELIGRDALDSGSLIIAAAGNESRRPGHIAAVGSPANCPSILAVAAIDRQLHVAPFSCAKMGTAPGCDVDLSGPGVDVFSSYKRPDDYRRLQGTSMATPHVSGVAALYAESDASYRGMKLWGALVQGRRAIEGKVFDVGAGLVQAP